MPPTNPADEVYASGIDNYCMALGYKTAWEILDSEVEKAIDSNSRQLFHLDGALMRETAEIAAQYPDWRIRFEPNGVTLSKRVDTDRRDEAEEILERIKAAFARRNKLPGLVSWDKVVKATISEEAVGPKDED